MDEQTAETLKTDEQTVEVNPLVEEKEKTSISTDAILEEALTSSLVSQTDSKEESTMDVDFKIDEIITEKKDEAQNEDSSKILQETVEKTNSSELESLLQNNEQIKNPDDKIEQTTEDLMFSNKTITSPAFDAGSLNTESIFQDEKTDKATEEVKDTALTLPVESEMVESPLDEPNLVVGPTEIPEIQETATDSNSSRGDGQDTGAGRSGRSSAEVSDSSNEDSKLTKIQNFLATTEFGDSLPSDILKPDEEFLEVSQLLSRTKESRSLSEELMDGIATEPTNETGISGIDNACLFPQTEEKSEVKEVKSPNFSEALRSSVSAVDTQGPTESIFSDTTEPGISLPLSVDSTGSALTSSDLKVPLMPELPLVSEANESPDFTADGNDMSKSEENDIKDDKMMDVTEDVPSNSISNEASLSNVEQMSVASEGGEGTLEFKFNIKKQLAAAELDVENDRTNGSSRDELGENDPADGNKRKLEDDDDKDDDEDEGSKSSTPRRTRRRKKRVRGERGKFMKEKPDPTLLDEDTRMELPHDEDSQGSTSNKREVRRFRCEVIVPESTEKFTAEKLVEYQWPNDSGGEHYFIQEHVSEYLGIMSFKRKYPHLRRHPLEMQERDYLKEMGIVSEIACDLGLTAVRSEDVLDVMFADFPDKFEELQELLRDRHEKSIKDHGKVDYRVADLDKSKIHEYCRKAAEDAARWNANLNKERRDDRKYSFDLQTFTLQLPTSRMVKAPVESTKLGAYPVAVIPGQYNDYYKE